jgi:hypothetical protein
MSTKNAKRRINAVIDEGSWSWLCEQADKKTRGNVTAYIMQLVDDMKEGRYVPRDVYDNQIRSKEEQVKMAKDFAAEIITRSQLPRSPHQSAG